MPDLIIKPQATSGNKVIIQDQGGGAVLTTADSGGANINIGSSSTFPTGHILQVLSTTKGDTFSTTSATYTLITGLTVEITMSNALNKVLVFLSIGRISPDTSVGASSAVKIVRGTTPIGGGTVAGTQVSVAFATNAGSTNSNYVGPGGLGAHFLDTPGTGTHVYGAYTVGADGGSSGYTHINRNVSGSTGSAAYETAASSTITVMEVVV